MKDWEMRHNAAEAAVGRAPYGTDQYWRNAAKVLSVHAGPGMRPETRAKLQALARSSDTETRRIAQRALAGHSYFE
jgi:hypothetical protein